ncbi:MAG TPA: ABC transporter permease [Chloroflexota bacterium]|jgi:simple sugar transport system permease protein
MNELVAAPTEEGDARHRRLAHLGYAILRPVLVVGVALLIGMAIIVYTGENPFPAYENLLIEPFRTWDTFSAVLFYAIPIVLTGLTAAISFRANVFNLGGEGQLQLGALATAWAAVAWSGLPGVVLLPLVILVGAVGGAAFAAIPGWLRAYVGATELVSTIMLNYVAIDIASFAVSPGGPLASSGSAGVATAVIPVGAQFPTIAGSQFHWGFVVDILAVVFAFVLLYRTPLGYEIRMAGHNPNFARLGGVPVPRVILGAMVIGGALAGIGGAVQVMGFQHQYTTTFAGPQWGFTGVTVALLARLEPIGVLVAAILYALLEEGSQLIANNTNVDSHIITVVQGLIILFVTVQVSLDWRKKLKIRGQASGA